MTELYVATNGITMSNVFKDIDLTGSELVDNTIKTGDSRMARHCTITGSPGELRRIAELLSHTHADCISWALVSIRGGRIRVLETDGSYK